MAKDKDSISSRPSVESSKTKLVARATEVMEQRVPYPSHVVDSLVFLQRLMLVFGQFPIQLKRNIFGRYEFPFTWLSAPAISFVCAMSLSTLLCFLFILNVLGAMSNVPMVSRTLSDYFTGNITLYHRRLDELGNNRTKTCFPLEPKLIRAEEIYIYKRNAVLVVMLLCSAIQSTVCSIVFFKRRYFLSYFLSFIVE